MSLLKFIVDTQLPPVLATYLRRKGLDATHTTHYPEAQFLSDSQIRKIAVEEDRIVITKDDDFADYFWAKGAPLGYYSFQLEILEIMSWSICLKKT